MAATAVLGKGISAGGFRFGDAAVHAMDGVLIHDWIMAGPDAWVKPMDFAEQQYGHYPALGIGRMYPPGFAAVEAVFFGVFGISIVSARLCVLFFGLLAVAGAYVFVRRWMGWRPAALTALLLCSMPAIVQWGRQTMLEVPALAVLIWAGVAVSRYLHRPTRATCALATGAAIAAILFKQPAVFLLGAFCVTVWVQAFRGRAPWAHALGLSVISVAVLAVVVLSLDSLGRQVISGLVNQPDTNGVSGLTYYARQMPAQVGTICLIAAMPGALLCFRRSKTLGVFLTAWLAVCYVMFTVIDCKNPRFMCLGLFPLAVWAALAVERGLAIIPSSRVRTVVAAGCAALWCASGFTRPVPIRPDYGVVVAAHRSAIEGRVVLFSGLRDGDFVFAVRQHLPPRSAVVIRGSKLLYTCNALPSVDFTSNAASPDDVARLVGELAFDHIFAERENKTGTNEDRMLRDYLASGGDYRLVHTHPFRSNLYTADSRVTIDVHERIEPAAARADHFDIFIPRTQRTVRVDLTRWSREPG